MHLRPEAIRWTQDDDFVEQLFNPKPLRPGQIIAGLVATILALALIAWAFSDGLKAERGSQPILLNNDLSYCYFWNGAELRLSQSPSSECRGQ